jgi:glycosidase
MAIDTPNTFRSLVIYEVYVRDHGPNGTFKDVEADLERIRDLGVDVVWFMPIHPIGKLNKKGELGCPYSIADYEEVNPEYGSRGDFKNLTAHAHELGLKVMIDVVYNHTAHDSRLVKEHPEWFHQDANGKPVTTVPDWSDVIDLNYKDEALETYLVNVLKQWAKIGVDGFRCDVASLIPLRLWQRARKEVAKVKPGVMWLAESVHLGFVEYRRKNGLSAVSDAELYQAFDMAYDYDIWPIWQAAVLGKTKTRNYLQMLRFQSGMYPGNYLKLRCVENHDQVRIMTLAPTFHQALAWTAFCSFLPGPFLIYGGQESAAKIHPTLFDRDEIEWGNYSLTSFIKTLTQLKKNECQKAGVFTILDDEPYIQAAWNGNGKALYGVFNVSGVKGATTVRIPDGVYTDLISGIGIKVKNGKIHGPQTAVIFEIEGRVEDKVLYSKLIDFRAD